MIQLIAPEFHDVFRDDLAEMFRLRCRVFKDRLDWTVDVHGDQELDGFDDLKPHYLLQRWQEDVVGCVRFLPTTGATMLSVTFPDLVAGTAMPESASIWESSRFALDVPRILAVRKAGLAQATYELFAGMIEFGLHRNLSQIVTVTDTRMERILRRAGWPLARLGEARQVGPTMALAGYLGVSRASLAQVCRLGGLRPPVLWRPALSPAA
jgi:acyl homoserine lactone synthase